MITFSQEEISTAYHKAYKQIESKYPVGQGDEIREGKLASINALVAEIYGAKIATENRVKSNPDNIPALGHYNLAG